MAKVAPKIIDKNAVPQKITIKEPAKGDNENPSNCLLYTSDAADD